jgi:5-hydroxyisourate hydrolase
MGLSTHVLDTMHGKPAQGMVVTLYEMQHDTPVMIRRVELNASGRNQEGALLDASQLQCMRYRLVFEVADYFRASGVELPQPPFFDVVTVDFGVAHKDANYHIPLLVSPWSYSTYRGS